MKKFAKFTISSLANIFVNICFKFRAGRYLLEKFYKNIAEHVQTVEHKRVQLKFYIPNDVTKWRIDTFSTKEPETLDWIDSFRENCTFWDIGANIGLYSCYAAKNLNCNVYAFEPSVFNLELLAKNIFINSLNEKITIVPLPLAENLMTKQFNMSEPDWGSAKSTFGENYGHDGSILDTKFKFKTVGISIDQNLSFLKLNQPNYIKMDVDGIEHLILKGAETCLKNVESLLIEVDEKYADQVKNVETCLVKAGFKLYEKKQSKMMAQSKISSIFNQIWIKN